MSHHSIDGGEEKSPPNDPPPLLKRNLTMSDLEDEQMAAERVAHADEAALLADDSSFTSSSELSGAEVDWDAELEESLSVASGGNAGAAKGPPAGENGLQGRRQSGGSLHRRYRSGSHPSCSQPVDSQSSRGWRPLPLVRQVWSELSLVVKLVIILVTPFAARQIGSILARRLWTRLYGPYRL